MQSRKIWNTKENPKLLLIQMYQYHHVIMLTQWVQRLSIVCVCVSVFNSGRSKGKTFSTGAVIKWHLFASFTICAKGSTELVRDVLKCVHFSVIWGALQTGSRQKVGKDRSRTWQRSERVKTLLDGRKKKKEQRVGWELRRLQVSQFEQNSG